jgi:hypothetical protein
MAGVTDVRQSRRCYLTRHLASGPCYHDPGSPFSFCEFTPKYDHSRRGWRTDALAVLSGTVLGAALLKEFSKYAHQEGGVVKLIHKSGRTNQPTSLCRRQMSGSFFANPTLEPADRFASPRAENSIYRSIVVTQTM